MDAAAAVMAPIMYSSKHEKRRERGDDRKGNNAGGGALDVRGGGDGRPFAGQLPRRYERLVQRELLECA